METKIKMKMKMLPSQQLYHGDLCHSIWPQKAINHRQASKQTNKLWPKSLFLVSYLEIKSLRKIVNERDYRYRLHDDLMEAIKGQN